MSASFLINLYIQLGDYAQHQNWKYREERKKKQAKVWVNIANFPSLELFVWFWREQWKNVSLNVYRGNI